MELSEVFQFSLLDVPTEEFVNDQNVHRINQRELWHTNGERKHSMQFE